jgi:hypothetical protein
MKNAAGETLYTIRVTITEASLWSIGTTGLLSMEGDIIPDHIRAIAGDDIGLFTVREVAAFITNLAEGVELVEVKQRKML